MLCGHRSFQGIQRSLLVLRGRPCHSDSRANPARRREGDVRRGRVRRPHWRRRFHLPHPAHAGERSVRGGRLRFRYTDSISVLRAGSACGIFLRKGSPRTVAPCTIDDSVDRSRDERASPLHTRRAGQLAGDRDEKLCEDVARFRIFDRPSHRCAVAAGARRLRVAKSGVYYGGEVNVSCPECQSVFRVDPTKVPSTGIRARCSVCGGVIAISAGTTIDEEFAPPRSASAGQRASRAVHATSGPAQPPPAYEPPLVPFHAMPPAAPIAPSIPHSAPPEAPRSTIPFTAAPSAPPRPS